MAIIYKFFFKIILKLIIFFNIKQNKKKPINKKKNVEYLIKNSEKATILFIISFKWFLVVYATERSWVKDKCSTT